jgi:DNA-binding NarL/FixJ family response regulator
MALREWIKNLWDNGNKPRKRRKSFKQSITAVDMPSARRETKSAHAGLAALTPREKEIVRLIRRGYSNKEIANELGISVTTVKWNITNILAKFNVETSKQLIVLLSALDTDDSRHWMIE